jgi:hypothetical protein
MDYRNKANSERCLDPFDFAEAKTFARHDKKLTGSTNLPSMTKRLFVLGSAFETNAFVKCLAGFS